MVASMPRTLGDNGACGRIVGSRTLNARIKCQHCSPWRSIYVQNVRISYLNPHVVESHAKHFNKMTLPVSESDVFISHRQVLRSLRLVEYMYSVIPMRLTRFRDLF